MNAQNIIVIRIHHYHLIFYTFLLYEIIKRNQITIGDQGVCRYGKRCILFDLFVLELPTGIIDLLFFTLLAFSMVIYRLTKCENYRVPEEVKSLVCET